MTQAADAPATAAAADVVADARAAAFDAWMREAVAHPHRIDLYQLLRRIDAAHPQRPRLGEALRPSDEPVRVDQPADLSFAASTVVGIEAGEAQPGHAPRRVRVQQLAFGLFGPNGPLPLHLTELARERARTYGDATLQRFADMLSHRFTLLFYRAWAQAQPVVELDRGADARLLQRLGSLAGIGLPSLQRRDTLGEAPKLHFLGRLSRLKRDADGLLAWCRSEFDAPVSIEQWRGHWMSLQRSERSRLGARDAAPLGGGVVLGAAVWDVQHRFLIRIGPLPLAQYLQFLPGARELARLRALVRQWVGIELGWDLQVLLRRDHIPRLRLGGRAGESDATRTGALGRSAWLGRYRKPGDADDYLIDVEETLRHVRRTPDPHLQPEAHR